MRDVGALNLAFGVILVVAAVLLERRLVQVPLAAYPAYAVSHFVLHLTTSHAFSLGDNIANLVALEVVLFPLALLLVGLRGAGSKHHEPKDVRRGGRRR